MTHAMDRASKSARNYDLNGWFEIKGNPLSKVGVFDYSGAQVGAPPADHGKIYKVFRPAEELANPETLASFRLTPLINDHAMLGEGFTDAENKGGDGVIGEDVYCSDRVLRGNIKVFSKTLGEDIKKGKTELSCGYRCTYDFPAGSWNGQVYDVIQRNIRGNHVALVDEGRMGPDVSVLDHLVFTVDAKETTSVDEELKKLLAPVMDSLEKLTASVAVLQTAKDEADKKAAAEEEAAAKAAADAAKDEDEDGEKKPDPAMDAALKQIAAPQGEIATLKGAKPAMDEAAIVALHADKSDLVERLSTHIGTFDHSRMTVEQVAAYGVEKLGIKNVPAGHERIALDAALQAKPVSTAITVAADNANSPLSASIAAFTTGA